MPQAPFRLPIQWQNGTMSEYGLKEELEVQEDVNVAVRRGRGTFWPEHAIAELWVGVQLSPALC